MIPLYISIASTSAFVSSSRNSFMFSPTLIGEGLVVGVASKVPEPFSNLLSMLHLRNRRLLEFVLDGDPFTPTTCTCCHMYWMLT